MRLCILSKIAKVSKGVSGQLWFPDTSPSICSYATERKPIALKFGASNAMTLPSLLVV